MAPHVLRMRGSGLVQERVGGVKHQAQFSSLIICWGTEGYDSRGKGCELAGHRDLHREPILGTGKR